jgi:aminoglycoside phosphotransferase (APT) family kinase protein
MDVNEDVEDGLVLALLREQRPDLAGLELRRVGRGWDNELWRLGDDLGIRLARTQRATELLRKEHRWLPEFAPHLPLAVPTPLYLAEPSELFPMPWTIVAWVPGEPADRAEVTDGSSARVLAQFLRALHSRELPEVGNYELSPRVLRNGGCEFGEDLISAVGEDRVRKLEESWQDAVSAPVWDGPPVWAHNDLHPANAVVTDGALSGVIDFGDLAPGDPAIDLAAAWTLLPSGSAEAFLQLYGDVNTATIRRARGWAVHRGVFVVAMALNGLRGLPGGKASWLPAGRRILDRVLESC